MTRAAIRATRLAKSKICFTKGHETHLPQTSAEHEWPPDIVFTCEEPSLARRETAAVLKREDGAVISGTRAFGHREIMDIKAAAKYLGVSRSHLSHILSGKVAGVPAIPHVRAGRRALIRRIVIDQWLLEQEHGRFDSATDRR